MPHKLTTEIANLPKEIAVDMSPYIRVYKDGSLERLLTTPYLPPSPEGDLQTGVLSKDVVISHNPFISVRLYLPKLTTPSNSAQNQKLPVFVYFHGGGFCMGSTSIFREHRYLNDMVNRANVVAVSVEYRLAPEHPLPAAYDDSWDALQWVASHSSHCPKNSEPWLINHGNYEKLYIGGDSAGANIVHDLLLRTGIEKLCSDVKILGSFLSCPYFWGSKPIGSEAVAGHEESFNSRIWNFVFPTAPGGIDNPMINPVVDGAPSLAGLACQKLLVCVAGKDTLRGRGVLYCEAVKKSGWQGELEVFEVEDEGHCFHKADYESENGKRMIKHLASFIN